MKMEASSKLLPHAYHLNLPPHHMDQDGVPWITKFAQNKARQIVETALSIQLTESLFVSEEPDDAEDAGDEDEDTSAPEEAPTLATITAKCARLQARLNALEGLKHGGISQRELCQIVLHLLKLLTATLTITYDEDQKRRVTIHYEQIGYLSDEKPADVTPPETPEQLEDELTFRFALPSPAREILLSIVMNILSNKGPLRSVSNAAVFLPSAKQERVLLILHWRVFLRMLLRTAPYLDEHKQGGSPTSSNSRYSTVLKRTVQLIRDARHFFDQGLPNIQDTTAREVWDMVKTDLLFHSHTHACYRGAIILYLFHPSRCSSAYYLQVLPHWLESWTTIDRCPEFDFLWMALFCRARKHLSPNDYDWGPVRRRLLTHCQYWLQLPIGGVSMDKSFPRAANPRSRSCPSRLKAFVGSSSSYEEGIDFVAKVTKLLVASLGTGPKDSHTSLGISEGTRDVMRFLTFVTPYFNPSNLGSWTFTLGAFLHYFSYELCCRMGTAASLDMLRQSNPELAESLCQVEPSLLTGIPAHEVVALMDALLPLCQQALYSKNGHVGRAGEAAMLYLTQIDPAHVCPAFIDFATRALDISAVNLSHQAPAALSALTRLVQPALRSDSTILLARLPEILRLSLAGIDSNDQNKTIRTLILYRCLVSWIPVGGKPDQLIANRMDDDTDKGDEEGTIRLGRDLWKYLSALAKSSDYLEAIEKLPESSLLRQGGKIEGGPEMQALLMEEAADAMSDWVLEFLERVYSLLRATGEREKTGKTSSGVASRHSSVDVQQARNFSRILKECMTQVFSAMDDTSHSLAVRSVVKFLSEETLPPAAKDASFLCQATAAARMNSKGEVISGLDALLPILMDDLDHHSNKTAVYRIRCLAGAVRSAGPIVAKHRGEITKVIDFALASKDKHVFKTGCKLLRHTLSTLCESYPLATDSMPRGVRDSASSVVLGKCAELKGNPLHWHVPDGASIDFAFALISKQVLRRMDSLTANENDESYVDVGRENQDVDQSQNAKSLDMYELRRCLRVVRYVLRGASAILPDNTSSVDAQSGLDVGNSDEAEDTDTQLIPYEIAAQQVLNASSPETRTSLVEVRSRLCSFIVILTSVIASESFEADVPSETHPTAEQKSIPSNGGGTDRNYSSGLSTDAKVCKEVCDIALLLLTRRGASFRSQEAKTVWKSQKQLVTDFALCAQADHVSETLQRAGLFPDAQNVHYKDGEDAGKTMPQRLLVTRILLFHHTLQRSASFEIPRRFRRLQRASKQKSVNLFVCDTNLAGMKSKLRSVTSSPTPLALDGYEGLMDGLFALSCHSNTHVRASAIGVIDYAITRFGWLVRPRVPRLLSAISLQDENLSGKFGLPSCAQLVKYVDGQGKRKRLAEGLKGICSILAVPRAVKELLGMGSIRFTFIETFCGTDKLMQLLPPEELQKIVHYLQNVFSPFRQKFYGIPRSSLSQQKSHEKCLVFLLNILSEKSEAASEESGVSGDVHWRKLLLVGWFLLSLVDSDDLHVADPALISRLWNTCFYLLESQMGQPLQRVGLGLFGRMISISGPDDDVSLLREKMNAKSFCDVFAKALVYDHREDSSVGGGHDAQWSAGVEDIIRDASRNLALRSLFPFQRTNQSSGTFKVAHAQLVEALFRLLDENGANVTARQLLDFAKELAGAPPSEDQRNQQCTSAEIFAGTCRALTKHANKASLKAMWESLFLPFLEEAIPKIPISLSGAYFDSFRYSIQFSPPRAFYPLTAWLFGKIKSSLWQPSSDVDGPAVKVPEESGAVVKSSSSVGSEGFTTQSKWLYLCCAILIEIDETTLDGKLSPLPWYTRYLVGTTIDSMEEPDFDVVEDQKSSWNLVNNELLPRLLEAVGHPYESCRDHIAGCLFRICYCHRTMIRKSASKPLLRINSNPAFEEIKDAGDPGTAIVAKLLSLSLENDWPFERKYNALRTARRFFSYCIHLGEAKHEFSDYIIPLLPLAFEALKSTVDETSNSTEDDNAAKRALEAEVVKGYRHTVAEVSIVPVVSYGRNDDITRVLDVAQMSSQHEFWQVRHASAHFLRCFQGGHKFLFAKEHAEKTTTIIAALLGDERREVSSAAMAALTGILAATSLDTVSDLVRKYAAVANRSAMKRKKKKGQPSTQETPDAAQLAKEKKRSVNQKTSVFFLCAAVLAQPYDTPPYVPVALAAISKHSFERNAPLGVRDAVKKCCAEYKRTHMSDNWELHRKAFTQEQLEALQDVVSSPHYYA